jgi:hypothetical protein
MKARPRVRIALALILGIGFVLTAGAFSEETPQNAFSHSISQYFPRELLIHRAEAPFDICGKRRAYTAAGRLLLPGDENGFSMNRS